jgi:hypothetical protein
MWFNLNRKTGEPGASDQSTAPVWVNGDSIQFIQPQAGFLATLGIDRMGLH